MLDDIPEQPASCEQHPASRSVRTGVEIIKPKRTVVIEPAVIALVLFGFPVGFVSSLYIIHKVTIELEEKHGMVNVSGDSNNTNPCTQNRSDPFYVFQQEVQTTASYFNILLTVASNIPSFFVSLFLGAYSDKMGRKYAILPPLCSMMLNALCLVVIIAFDLRKEWMFLGAVLNGCGGYFTCFLMGCFSYIADITEPDKRMLRIAVVEMCMVGSMVFTPIGLGYVIEKIGFLYPFIYVCIGLSLTILYVIFFVPETIKKDPNADNRFFSTDHLKKTAKLFTTDNGTDRRWQLNLLMGSFLVSTLPNMDLSLNTLFETNEPLCWNSVIIGYFMVVYVAVSSIGGIVSAKLFKCCLPDQAIVLIACLGALIYNVYKAFVQNTIMMFCGSAIAMFSILLIPTTRALMSQLVTETEQGAVFGAIACAEVACNLVGTTIFNGIYVATLDISSGFVFIVMAAFYFVAGLFLVVYLGCLYRRNRIRKYSQLLIDDHETVQYDDCNPLING